MLLAEALAVIKNGLTGEKQTSLITCIPAVHMEET